MSVLLYADDMKLFLPILNRNDCERAQKDLDNLCEWCERNKLFLNISKCKVISFSRAKNVECFDYSLNGEILERVNVIRDLGVLLDSRLSFDKHVDTTISKAQQTLGFIMRIGREFKDPYTFKSLFMSLVRSKLEYASCVWCPYQSGRVGRLESVQKKFLKYALRRMGWINEMPQYEHMCLLLNVDTLKKRRMIARMMLIRDLLCSRIDSSNLLNAVSLLAAPIRTRSNELICERTHRTNYGQHEPINSAIRSFNSHIQYFDFCVSREGYQRLLRLNI
jgi:hypothetical protein